METEVVSTDFLGENMRGMNASLTTFCSGAVVGDLRPVARRKKLATPEVTEGFEREGGLAFSAWTSTTRFRRAKEDEDDAIFFRQELNAKKSAHSHPRK